MIKKYHNHCGLIDNPKTTKIEDRSGIAWCASFVSWCLDQTDYKGLKTVGSRFYLADDKEYNTKLAIKAKDIFIKKREPFYGALVVFSDCNSSGVSKSQGHVGFVYGKLSNGKMAILGGNQGDRLKVSAYDCSGKVFLSYTDRKGKKHYKKFRGYYCPINYRFTSSELKTYSTSKEANKDLLNVIIQTSKNGESSR